MIDIIEKLEEKGFRICVYPRKVNGTWTWCAGVYIGSSNAADWVDSNNDLPLACYKTYKEAFISVVNYCKSYKPKVKKSK